MQCATFNWLNCGGPDGSARLALRFGSVSKAFGRGEAAVRVLHEVSVDIARQEFFTLLGPSGCGKTTLLRLIAGFEICRFRHDPDRRAGCDPCPALPRPVNTVFQNYALFPHLTVEAERRLLAGRAAFAARPDPPPRRRGAGDGAHAILCARRRPSDLSGGQQQRVALARALAPRPKLLLLDEPLSALDLKLRKEMQIELKQLQAEAGITFLFVTHDQEEALTLSDRMAVMQGGRILQMGPPREIYETPDASVRRGLYRRHQPSGR
jgi:spermidine/putrescine transport system ATP-binding protein